MIYSEQLKSPHWQRKRLEVLERDGFKCRECKCSNKELHIHHGYYEKGKKPWEYENKYLHTLCIDCHKRYHETFDMFVKLTGEMMPSTLGFLYGILDYLDKKASGISDYDNGDLFCYADWIIENIQAIKKGIELSYMDGEFEE